MKKNDSRDMSREVKDLLNTIKGLEYEVNLHKAYEKRAMIGMFVLALSVTTYKLYEHFF